MWYFKTLFEFTISEAKNRCQTFETDYIVLPNQYEAISLLLKHTCGVISPKTTISNVDEITAINPDVRLSRRIVNVEFTSTLPVKKE